MNNLLYWKDQDEKIWEIAAEAYNVTYNIYHWNRNLDLNFKTISNSLVDSITREDVLTF